jgi:hypothetical protein
VNGGEWTEIETALVIEEAGGEYTIDDTNVIDGNTYCYRVKHHIDDSDWSNEECVEFSIVQSAANDTRGVELTGSDAETSTRDTELRGE